jgi:hypothetical protein
MKTINRVIAVLELFLVLPAALFMAALFLREVQPAPYEPSQTARRLVDWFSSHPPLGLDIFLVLLPLAAFVIGCVTLFRAWRGNAMFRQAALGMFATVRSQMAALLIAGATLIAGGVPAIVALHMITE